MTEKSTFEVLENGIYRAYWRTTEMEEIQEYSDWFMSAYNQLQPNETIRVLHDFRETPTPPFNRLRQVMGNMKFQKDKYLRAAHIYDDLMYPVIMKNVTIVAGMDATRKFFKPDEENDAIAWLLEV